MVLSTQILRLSDQLPLSQSVDDDQTDRDLAEVKQQAKLVIKRLGANSENRCSIESGKYTLHYLMHPPPPQPTPTTCVYLTIAPKSYPRKLAFSFLDELAREFEQSYGAQVGQRSLRPYAFVGFDTFLQKTKRLYADSRSAEATAAAASSSSSSSSSPYSAAASGPSAGNPTSSNLDRLNNDLQDVTRIMTKNMEDLLWRGDSLDQMSTMSSSLRDESMKYRRAARRINVEALIRQYAPLGAIVFLFLFILWIKFG